MIEIFSLLLALVVFALVHREFFWMVFLFFHRSYHSTEMVKAILYEAQKRKTPDHRLFTNSSLSLVSFDLLFGTIVYIHEDLWKELTSLEKESLLTWFDCSRGPGKLIQRLLGVAKLSKVDRDVLYWGYSSLDLLSALTKVDEFQKKQKSLNVLESFFGGLSPVPQSPFFGGERLERRIQKINHVATRLKTQIDI